MFFERTNCSSLSVPHMQRPLRRHIAAKSLTRGIGSPLPDFWQAFQYCASEMSLKLEHLCALGLVSERRNGDVLLLAQHSLGICQVTALAVCMKCGRGVSRGSRCL